MKIIRNLIKNYEIDDIDELMIATSWNRVNLSLGAASRWQMVVTSDLDTHEISWKSCKNHMKSNEKRTKSMIIDDSNKLELNKTCFRGGISMANGCNLGPRNLWNPMNILWKSCEILSKTFEIHDNRWIGESMIAASWNRVKLSLGAASRWQTVVTSDLETNQISWKSYEILWNTYENDDGSQPDDSSQPRPTSQHRIMESGHRVIESSSGGEVGGKGGSL